MPRLVRHAFPALVPVLLASALVALGPGASFGASGPLAPLAAVEWPPSTGLVVGEIVTGGASASDEFVELYNAGPASVDLAGLEVVYVTSTGGTVTRKATWASATILEPGRHLLLANSSGIHAATADATYTGGLSATGGAIVVRPVGGTAIDAVGWGDATSAFVEGTVAPAPSAGSSLERLPGGPGGNGIDTNQNVADWLLNPAPVPQALAAAAVPAVGPTPTPTPTATPSPTPTPTPTATATPTPAPTATPSPTPTPTPTPTATPTATPSPTPTPTPTPTATPTPSPTATPTPTPAPTATPSPTASPSPTPSATPHPTPIADVMDIISARAQAPGSRVRLRGIVTVEPGRIVDDRTFAIQDATGGILVRLDGGRKDVVLARGTDLFVEGRLTARYGTLEIRLDDDDPLEVLGIGALPAARVVQLAELGEATEALLVLTSGAIVDIDTTKNGTTTAIIEDASGQGRIVAFAGAGALPDGLRRGVSLVVQGIAGQRASATGRLDGYRIWVRDGSDLRIVAPVPTPSPSASADATEPPTVVTIAAARTLLHQKVAVVGTVTSRGGLLDGDGRRVTIQDGSAGILVRLAAREAAPPVGSRVRVVGSVGTYYGAPQLSASGPAERLGSGTVSPVNLTKAPGAGVEWQLVRINGTVVDVKRYGQAWRAELALPSGTRIPIVGLARAGIAVDRITEGQQGAIVGLVRRAYPSAKDTRFAVLPRGRADLDLHSATSPRSQPAGASRSSSSGDPSSAADGPRTDTASGADPEATPATIEAAELSANVGRLVRVGGLVVRVLPVDGQGPIVVLEDASGSAAVQFPAEAATMAMALTPGDLVEVRGTVAAVEDGQAVVVVDDSADVVVAGQVADAQSGQGSDPSGGSGVAGAGAQADAGPTGDPGSEDAADHGVAPVAPQMGAAGAGVFLAAILATGAVGARWRRRRAEREASKEATERLVELLSTASEPPVGS